MLDETDTATSEAESEGKSIETIEDNVAEQMRSTVKTQESVKEINNQLDPDGLQKKITDLASAIKALEAKL